MSDTKDLGRRLRDADPAAGAELEPGERARIRAALRHAATERPRSRRRPWILLATAGAMVALVLIAGRWPAVPRRTANGVAASIDSTARIPETAVSSVVTQAASPPPMQPASRPVRHNGAVKVRASEVSTQIRFTAPGGTRIFWFPAPPRAKEDRS